MPSHAPDSPTPRTSASETFADLGLPPVLVHSLQRTGIRAPFPIQIAAIPDALAGRDVLGRAPTGSGKTIAFGVPMLVRLAGRRSAPRRPRGLVLLPTRELALQVEEALAEHAATFGIRLVGVVGGVPIKRNSERIERGVDIVVATPGRLVDLLERDLIDLRDVEVTAVDEADRMVDLGFLPEVDKILDLTPSGGQRLLFSATLDAAVSKLVARHLDEPVQHEVSGDTSEPDIEHYFFRVASEDKAAVAAVIASRDGRTLLFASTKLAVDRVTEELRRAGVAASALHGDKSQYKRAAVLASFAAGSSPVLVATDVAARGIHVDDVSLVLQVDLPADATDYVHRSGRTARAGHRGVVVVLITDNDVDRAGRHALAAGIDPTVLTVTSDSAELRRLTGGRTPSGVPVVDTEIGAAGASRRASDQPHSQSRPQRRRAEPSGRAARQKGRGGPREGRGRRG